MQHTTTPAFASAMQRYEDSRAAFLTYMDLPDEVYDEKSDEYLVLSKAEDDSSNEIVVQPAVTAAELSAKIAILDHREAWHWNQWDEMLAQIQRDLLAMRRPASTLGDLFRTWRVAWQANSNGGATFEEDQQLCGVAGDAFLAVMRAPCVTPGDFIVKAYMNLLGEVGVRYADALADGADNDFDIDIDRWPTGAVNLNDAWTHSAYHDLDQSDLGACLLAFGDLDFCPAAWMERANAVGLGVYLMPADLATDGKDALCIRCAAHDEPSDRILRERRRLERLLAFDPARTGHVIGEIRSEWPQLICREQAA